MKTTSIFISLILGLLALNAPSTFAAERTETSIKQSLLRRVAVIDGLKLSGKVGENNLGTLTQRGLLSTDETRLMNGENKDRMDLYTILAKRLNLTVSVVGQGRAEELRKKSAAGVWLQDPKGDWYQQN
ncbi:MAG: DUF1318 domain-containing protein [Verrucomicrobia bacterium]|nr:DUF1318 domain-containing protein [Verrucomicrobiota bacterium]MDA1068942.1 DUF1318 domain-containing protein [Verrucomicrobiota bacterium]